jgi:hypothetical protein
MLPAVALAIPGHGRESRRRSYRGRREESDGCICTCETSNKTDDNKSVAESVEGRRPVEGKASSDACSGLSARFSMSLKRRAYGSVASKPTVAFDLRQEPTAGKSHGGICGGCRVTGTSTRPSKPVVLRGQSEQDVDQTVSHYLDENALQAALGFVDALEQA